MTQSILGGMSEVTIHEAKTHLSRLLRRVSAGETIIIMRGRKPVARLAPLESRAQRELGFDKGAVKVAADFDAPLPEDVLRDFDG
jgi:prevent-host-death family protein